MPCPLCTSKVSIFLSTLWKEHRSNNSNTRSLSSSFNGKDSDGAPTRKTKVEARCSKSFEFEVQSLPEFFVPCIRVQVTRHRRQLQNQQHNNLPTMMARKHNRLTTLTALFVLIVEICGSRLQASAFIPSESSRTITTSFSFCNMQRILLQSPASSQEGACFILDIHPQPQLLPCK